MREVQGTPTERPMHSSSTHRCKRSAATSAACGGFIESNLFACTAKSETIFATANFPRSWNDTKVADASGLHNLLPGNKVPTGYAILADSTFPWSAPVLKGKIVRASVANEVSCQGDVPNSAWLAAVNVMLEQAMRSESQSV